MTDPTPGGFPYRQFPHEYAGSNSDRQSIGDPGHCEDCCSVGHVEAHPDLGCGDVGCVRDHPDPTPTPDTAAPALPDEVIVQTRVALAAVQSQRGLVVTPDDVSEQDAHYVLGAVLEHVATWRQINDAMLNQVLKERDQATAGSGAADPEVDWSALNDACDDFFRAYSSDDNDGKVRAAIDKIRAALTGRDPYNPRSGAAALTDANAVIAKLQEIADQYPADVFTPAGKTPDAIAGTAIRERMLAEIRHLREDGDGGECAAALTNDIEPTPADDYRDVADVVIAAFNPPEDDVAEFHIVVTAIQRAAEFAASQPCLCTPDATDPDVLATPCARCLVLGRRGDRLEER